MEVRRSVEDREKEKKKFEALKKITEDELLALEQQFSHFDSGNEFLSN